MEERSKEKEGGKEGFPYKFVFKIFLEDVNNG